MGKMFKTVYPQSVDNDNLLKIGEMRIGINPSNNVTQFFISALNGISKKSVKNGYITDEAGNVNNGNTSDNARVFLSPSSTALIIDNKYKLNELQVLSNNASSISIDLSDLRYTDTMTKLNLDDTNVSGSLSDISNMTNLTVLRLSGINVSGSLSDISNMTNLTSLRLSNVSGSLSDISNMTNLTSLGLSGINVSGSLSDISNMTNLTVLGLSNTNVSGDLSELPATLNTFFNYKGSIGGKLSSLKNIINLTNVVISEYVTGDISDIDSLTKLKTLTIPSTITHTDAQVKALQDKGVTVTIY